MRNAVEKKHFLIVDDDKATVEVYAKLLEQQGHEVFTFYSGLAALDKIESIAPDCVLCDLTMPDIGGFELFKQIRRMKDIHQPTFIVITSKIFKFDKEQALAEGVDGYFTKPINPDTFVNDVLTIMAEQMRIRFWGVRGTLPVSGKKTNRYGGNTNCVTLNFGSSFFIFDAGTGIKELSNYLMHNKIFPVNAKIFISHPHYDHINGIPFFVPLYMQGNDFEIFGTNHGDLTIERLISGQMDTVYFPITIKEFAANFSFRNLAEETIVIDTLKIKTQFLNHPGNCLGYRVQNKTKSFCYISDNELYREDSPYFNQFEVDRLISFIKDVDILVIDCTYTDEEYPRKIGWGHSSVSRVVDVADKANVKTLCLYHHDPDQLDKDIDAKLHHARSILKARKSKTNCIAPREGDQLII